MKWFKHYANAGESEVLSLIIEKMGNEGYGLYWRLFEILSSNFDGECTEFTFRTSFIKRQLGLRSTTKLTLLCNLINTQSTLSTNSTPTQSTLGVCLKKDNVFINAPILLKLKDRDFKKSRNSRAKNALDKNRVDKNREDKRRVDKPKATAAFINKLDSEIQVWLGKVTQRTIDKWVKEYSEDLILKEINKAYDWNAESNKKVKSVGSFISNWLGRCEKEEKDIGDKVHDFLIEQGVNLDHLA